MLFQLQTKFSKVNFMVHIAKALLAHRSSHIHVNNQLYVTFSVATCDAVNYLPNAVSPTLNCYTIKASCLASSTALIADATIAHYQFTEQCCKYVLWGVTKDSDCLIA